MVPGYPLPMLVTQGDRPSEERRRGSRRPRIRRPKWEANYSAALAVGDLMVISAASAASFLLRDRVGALGTLGGTSYAVLAAALVAVWLPMLVISGAYEVRVL